MISPFNLDLVLCGKYTKTLPLSVFLWYLSAFALSPPTPIRRAMHATGPQPIYSSAPKRRHRPCSADGQPLLSEVVPFHFFACHLPSLIRLPSARTGRALCVAPCAPQRAPASLRACTRFFRCCKRRSVTQRKLPPTVQLPFCLENCATSSQMAFH